MHRLALLFSALVVATATASRAPSTPRPEILILCNYHMASPGHDLYNMEVDDVLSLKRQQEMTRLIES